MTNERLPKSVGNESIGEDPEQDGSKELEERRKTGNVMEWNSKTD